VRHAKYIFCGHGSQTVESVWCRLLQPSKGGYSYQWACMRDGASSNSCMHTHGDAGANVLMDVPAQVDETPEGEQKRCCCAVSRLETKD
jgi:hypothetical protein